MADAIDFQEVLRGSAARFGVELNGESLAIMARHYDLVVRANRALNLTAIVDPAQAAAKHYCDSLAILRIMDARAKPGRAADVGSGAGFPGFPLAAARPKWRFTIIEAKRKKCDFLAEAARALGLNNVEIVAGRSEIVGAQDAHREAYDLVAGRAIASLATVAETLLPLAKPGGFAVAMKTPPQYLGAEALSALRRLGAGQPRLENYQLPDEMGDRVLVVIPKIAPGPREFPRRPGMAAKRPLF